LGDIEVAYNPNYIISLEVDDAGHVWAGTWGGGLSRVDGKRWMTLTVADGLPGNHIFALGRDPEGTLWIGTSRGLARYRDGTFEYLGREQGLYSDIVFSIEFAEDGAAWIGSLGGVTWFPEGPAGSAVKG
jgi:ligand-binding sensor domain-containing protein